MSDTSTSRPLHAALAFALATLSGVATFLSFPNWNLFGLGFVSLVPLLLVVQRRGRWGAFWAGTWMGLVTNLGGFYWVIGLLRDFTGMPISVCLLAYGLLCLQQGLLYGVAATITQRLTTRTTLPWWLVAAATFGIVDAVWPMIFKWYFGNSQYLNHALAQLAELGGVPLISLALFATNAVLADVLASRGRAVLPESHRRIRIQWAAVGVCLALAHLWGAVRIQQVDARTLDARTLRVGMVEANIGIFEKADPALVRNNLLIHQRLSAVAEGQGAELILWPETAFIQGRTFGATEPDLTEAQALQQSRLLQPLPREVTWLPPSRAPLVADVQDDERLRTPLEDRVVPHRGFSVPLLTGVLMYRWLTPEEAAVAPPRRSGRPRESVAHNSAMLVMPNGQVVDVFDKNILMPISERVPLGREIWNWFGVNVYGVIPAAGDTHLGGAMPPMTLPHPDGGDPVRIAVMICYEDIAPEIGRTLHALGRPHFIANLTNDAWFGKTAEPYLHMALATFRAIEQRTWLLRSTNSGVSCAIDAVGRVVAETSLEDEEVLVHDVPLLEAQTTLFMRIGAWSVWLCGFICVLAAVRRRSLAPAIPSAPSEEKGQEI